MKINEIYPKTNRASLTNKDNTDYGYNDIVRDLKKAKHELENAERKPEAPKKFEQDWFPVTPRIPVIKAIDKKESGFVNIVEDSLNITTSEINSLIDEITEDETGENIDVGDLEFCLDLLIERSK